MSEYRERWSNLSGVEAAIELLERVVKACGVPMAGAMLSTVSFVASSETVVVSARLVFCEHPLEPRPDHVYPGFVLRDKWLTNDEAHQLLRDASAGASQLLPGKLDASASAERLITTHGFYEPYVRPVVMLTFPLGDRRTPEVLPAVAFGLTPFPTWIAAGMWWFNEDGNDLKHLHALRVVLPDYRATIESAELLRGELRIKVSVRDTTKPWELHYLLGEDRRPVGRGRVAVAGDLVVIPVQHRFRKAEAWLVCNGASLPAVHRAFWSLRDEYVEHDADAIGTHVARILGGETDMVELKPFLDDAKKVTEVAESVTAFANTRGGYVYVGVQDDCVVQGLAKLEGLHKGDKRQAREAQSQKIREVIGRIDPVPAYSMTWIDLNAGPVLVVESPQGNDVHALDGTRFLVRRGASDRSATRSELEELFRERGAAQRAIRSDDEEPYLA